MVCARHLVVNATIVRLRLVSSWQTLTRYIFFSTLIPFSAMDQATHNKIVSFIWSIADDVLRDLFKRGKYPDVILPMCVLRRLDAVLEPTKKAVLETKDLLDKARITEQSDPHALKV
jgi:hypothetical protein